MEGEHGRQKIVFLLVATLLVGSLFLLLKKSPSELFERSGGLSSSRCLSSGRIDSLCVAIQDGDLACRMGDGYFSEFFRRANGEHSRFSHIGIVCKEESGCFVIHSEASEFTGIGFVRKDSLAYFLEGAYDWEIYPVGDTALGKIAVTHANGYYEKKIPFDLDFDLATDSAYYCTELVAVCFDRAAGKALVIPTGRMRGLDYYRVDDLISAVSAK